MKKFLFFLLSIAFILSQPILTYAQSTKVITLTDGSVIKGKVIGVKNSEYVINTENMGELRIQDSDIQNIQSLTSYKIQQQDQQQTSDPSIDKVDLEKAVGEMKQKIMTDPAMLDQIKNLTQNEELMKIIQDPQLIKDAMSMDPERIQNNPNIQKLLDIPEIQNLIDQAELKMPGD